MVEGGNYLIPRCVQARRAPHTRQGAGKRVTCEKNTRPLRQCLGVGHCSSALMWRNRSRSLILRQAYFRTLAMLRVRVRVEGCVFIRRLVPRVTKSRRKEARLHTVHTQLATSAITNLYALGGWLSLIVEEERFPTCGALVILVITCYSSE